MNNSHVSTSLYREAVITASVFGAAIVVAVFGAIVASAFGYRVVTYTPTKLQPDEPLREIVPPSSPPAIPYDIKDIKYELIVARAKLREELEKLADQVAKDQLTKTPSVGEVIPKQVRVKTLPMKRK